MERAVPLSQLSPAAQSTLSPELEVEVGDGLVERQPRVAQPGCEAAVAGVDGLFVEAPGQVFDVGPLVGAGIFCEGVGEDLGALHQRCTGSAVVPRR